MKYKNLKSVAHNFGHSFTSDMNWVDGDYVKNHLARAAIHSGVVDFWADLITGEAGPSALALPPVRESISQRRTELTRLLASQSTDRARVPGAAMRLRLDVARRSAHPSQPEIWEFPFECVVELTNDRGVIHRGEVRDWWRGYTRTPDA